MYLPDMHDVVEGAEKLSNGIKDAVHHAEEFVAHEIDHLLHDSALAGNIWPTLERLIPTPKKMTLIAQNIVKVTQWQDLVLIFLLGWCTVPIARVPYQTVYTKPFQQTVTFQFFELLSQIAKIALAVYCVDVLKIITFPHILDLPRTFAKIAYTAWMAKKVANYKKHALKEFILRGGPDKLGRVKVVNRLLNAVILGLFSVFVFDVLSVELGFAGKSIFAFGSVSTLVVSLASQGLASQVLNGLMLSASDRIYEGDSVRFGNGISGTVERMGWMETILRQPDDSKLSVPNADLASQQVSNLSRVHRSQVKQTLRFQYADVDKLPKLIEDIKREIREACPMLIIDGSRPFRVHFTCFQDDHLEVVVDTHFLIKPIGDVYHDNRQNVLLAINRAVKKNDVSFSIKT